MVGGGPVGDDMGFGRLAAKIPARRMTDALERLIELYVAERAPAETASAFFMRVDVGRVKETLSDLERLAIDETVPEDFIDLAETTEFKPEIQEGECSA
jgi:sulfite reductase (NADPH) hemoprotein beta-component